MSNQIVLKMGSLFIAVPRQEVLQIKPVQDIRFEGGSACIHILSCRVPVVSLDQHFQVVRFGKSDFVANHAIILGHVNQSLTLEPCLALQVEAILRNDIASFGYIPTNMHKTQSPILGWFDDVAENHGFLTQTALIEAFINHSTKVVSVHQERSLVG